MLPIKMLGALAPLAVVAVMLSGHAGAAGGRPIPLLDPARLPELPRQGLIVARTGGVLFETTAGRAIGLLPGFSFAPPENVSGRLFERSVGIGALESADPELTVLYDRS